MTYKNQTSLRYLLSLAEEIHGDIGRLAQQSEAGREVPSLSLSANIYLPDGQRRADFLREAQQAVEALARKYDAPADVAGDPALSPGQGFRLVVACYPTPDSERNAP